MDQIRSCGECSVCCVVAEVKEGVVDKPACSACPFLDRGCTLFSDSHRPAVCHSFECAWIQGHGTNEDIPIKNGIMASVNTFNGGTWIMVLDLVKHAHQNTGKNLIVDMATKIDLPVIICDYDNLKTGKGDYVIIKKSLESRSSKIRGELIDAYTDTMNIYKLVIS